MQHQFYGFVNTKFIGSKILNQIGVVDIIYLHHCLFIGISLYGQKVYSVISRLKLVLHLRFVYSYKQSINM